MASDGWDKVRVSDLVERGALSVDDGYRVRNEELGPIGIPFVRGGDIGYGSITTKVSDHIRPEYADRVQKKLAQPFDVAFISKGTVGRVGLLRVGQPNVVFAPQVCYWRALDPKQINPRFLYYLLTSHEFQANLDAVKTHGSMVADYVSLSDQRAFSLTIPPIEVQDAIANILGVLDDKIELNRRMNETLEGLARAIFQSWFVDFDPVRAQRDGLPPPALSPTTAALFPDSFEDSELGKIPNGWRVATVTELADINSWTLSRNDELDRVHYVEISEVVRGNVANIQTYSRGEEPSRARRRLRHGDTVLSTVRPDRGSYFLCLNPSSTLIASTGFAVVSPTNAPWGFIHAALTRNDVFEHLGQHADGGAYPAVRPEIIGNVLIPWPDERGIADEFHRVSAPMFQKADENRRESRKLAAIRDALLPKLLSGEIRVAEAERLVEKTT